MWSSKTAQPKKLLDFQDPYADNYQNLSIGSRAYTANWKIAFLYRKAYGPESVMSASLPVRECPWDRKITYFVKVTLLSLMSYTLESHQLNLVHGIYYSNRMRSQ